MGNMTVENVDLGGVVLNNAKYVDDIFAAAGAGTTLKGTILARKRVLDAVVVAAKAGNTGTGTLTVASVAAGQFIPIVGAYALTCVTAVANGGIFKLVDPNGAIVASDIKMTAGAGAATIVEAAGLIFTLTDADDFIVGDGFTITVAVSNKLVVFASAGAGGAQIPCAVLGYPVVAAGAGDIPIRALVGGDVRKDKLIIAADGTSANVNAIVRDQLRQYGINVIDVKQLGVLDNQ